MTASVTLQMAARGGTAPPYHGSKPCALLLCYQAIMWNMNYSTVMFIVSLGISPTVVTGTPNRFSEGLVQWSHEWDSNPHGISPTGF